MGRLVNDLLNEDKYIEAFDEAWFQRQQASPTPLLLCLTEIVSGYSYGTKGSHFVSESLHRKHDLIFQVHLL